MQPDRKRILTDLLSREAVAAAAFRKLALKLTPADAPQCECIAAGHSCRHRELRAMLGDDTEQSPPSRLVTPSPRVLRDEELALADRYLSASRCLLLTEAERERAREHAASCRRSAQWLQRRIERAEHENVVPLPVRERRDG